MSNEPPVRGISDTAAWVAMYRAAESERPDAAFRDPYARRLAGERGERIMATMAWGAVIHRAAVERSADLARGLIARELLTVLLRYLGRRGARRGTVVAAGRHV